MFTHFIKKLKIEGEYIKNTHCGNSGEKNDPDIACSIFFDRIKF